MDVSSMMFPYSFQYASLIFQYFPLQKSVSTPLFAIKKPVISFQKKISRLSILGLFFEQKNLPKFLLFKRLSQPRVKRCSRLSNFLPYIPKRNYHHDRFELLQCSLDQSCIRWTLADFLVEKEVATKRQDDMGLQKFAPKRIKFTKSFEIGFGEKNRDSYCSILIFCWVRTQLHNNKCVILMSVLEIVLGAFFGVSRVKPTPRNIQDHCRTHWVCWRNFFKTNMLIKTHPETRTNNWLTQLKFQKQSTYHLQPIFWGENLGDNIFVRKLKETIFSGTPGHLTFFLELGWKDEISNTPPYKLNNSIFGEWTICTFSMVSMVKDDGPLAAMKWCRTITTSTFCFWVEKSEYLMDWHR